MDSDNLTARIANHATRFRFPVVAIWLLLGIVGLWASSALPSLLTDSVQVPGSDSARADAILQHRFGLNPEGTFTVVIALRPGVSTTSVTNNLQRAIHVIPGAHLEDIRTGAALLYANVVTPFSLPAAQSYTARLRGSLIRQGLVSAEVTGAPALQHDVLPLLSNDLHRGELIAAPILLVVLVLVLGFRWIALVPIAIALVAMQTALLLVFALAHVVAIVSYVPNLVEFLALGLSVDYSLFVCSRYVQEARVDVARQRLIRTTMATAARAAALSGIVVAVSLASLLLVPIPFIQSLGVAGVIVPLVCTACVLTLVPSLLALLPHTSRRAASDQSRPQPAMLASRWAAFGGQVVRRPLLSLALSIGFLVLLSVPVLDVSISPGSTNALPVEMPSGRALSMLVTKVGAGPISPIQVVIDAGHERRARTSTATKYVNRLANRIFAIHENGMLETFVVAMGHLPPYVDSTGRYRRLIVISRDDFGASATQGLVRDVRTAARSAELPRGYSVSVGGIPAQGLDFVATAYEWFPIVVGMLVLLTLAFLLATFRMLWVALAAVCLTGLSTVAAFGVLVWFVQDNVAHTMFGLYQAPQIEAWVPLFLGAVMFGMSMDYQIFLLSGFREARRLGMGGEQAVTAAVTRTGSVITGAGAIMVAALVGLMIGHIGGLQELGIGLGIAVALDVVLVRMIALPAAMTLATRTTNSASR